MPSASPAVLPDPAPDRPSRLDHASVLVVDDSAYDRERITRHCRNLGLALTITCADTLAAMEAALGRARFDLILLDFSLPDGDGTDGLDRISASPRNPDTATIVITSREEPAIMEQTMEHGAVDFIKKSDLSTATIHRAALNALQKAGLMRNAQAEAAARAAIEAGLRTFGATAAEALSDALTEMIYRLDLVEDHAHPPGISAELTLMARACDRMAVELHRLTNPSAAIIADVAHCQRDVARRIRPGGAGLGTASPDGSGPRRPTLFARYQTPRTGLSQAPHAHLN